MDNSTKIEMLCELAHNRVLMEEKKENEHRVLDEELSHYTEEGQELFDIYYDYYEGIISKYKKKKNLT